MLQQTSRWTTSHRISTLEPSIRPRSPRRGTSRTRYEPPPPPLDHLCSVSSGSSAETLPEPFIGASYMDMYAVSYCVDLHVCVQDRVKKMNWERSIAEDAEDSFKAYLASSGSDSDSDDDDSAKAKKRKAIRQRYAALLGSDNEEEDEDEEEKVESEGDDLAEHSDEEAPVKSKSKKSKGGRVKVHDDGMEITFTPGLESKLTKQLEESKKRTSESVWEQYLRKRKEKKRERKLAAKQASAARQAGDAAGEPVRKPTISGKKAGKGSKFSDPLFAMVDDAGSDGGMESAAVPAGGKQLKSERISKREEKERQAAELELLMGNADDQPEGFDMKEVWKAARKAERAAVRKAKKGKKGAKVEMEADDAGFKINTKDSRFARLHTDASFSIDPTDPSFKQTPVRRRSGDRCMQLTRSKAWLACKVLGLMKVPFLVTVIHVYLSRQ